MMMIIRKSIVMEMVGVRMVKKLRELGGDGNMKFQGVWIDWRAGSGQGSMEEGVTAIRRQRTLYKMSIKID